MAAQDRPDRDWLPHLRIEDTAGNQAQRRWSGRCVYGRDAGQHRLPGELLQQAVGVGAERVEALADGQRGAVSEMDNADLQFAEGAVDVTGGPAIS